MAVQHRGQRHIASAASLPISVEGLKRQRALPVCPINPVILCTDGRIEHGRGEVFQSPSLVFSSEPPFQELHRGVFPPKTPGPPPPPTLLPHPPMQTHGIASLARRVRGASRCAFKKRSDVWMEAVRMCAGMTQNWLHLESASRCHFGDKKERGGWVAGWSGEGTFKKTKKKKRDLMGNLSLKCGSPPGLRTSFEN